MERMGSISITLAFEAMMARIDPCDAEGAVAHVMVLNIGSIFTPSVTCPPARAKCGNSKAKTVAIAYFIFVLPNNIAC